MEAQLTGEWRVVPLVSALPLPRRSPNPAHARSPPDGRDAPARHRGREGGRAVRVLGVADQRRRRLRRREGRRGARRRRRRPAPLGRDASRGRRARCSREGRGGGERRKFGCDAAGVRGAVPGAGVRRWRVRRAWECRCVLQLQRPAPVQANHRREVQKRICVAGEDPTFVESPTEPKWSSKGELFFITDRQSGFWNIHKWDEQSNVVVQVYSINAEFSKPMWIFGVSSYDFLRNDDSSQKIACCYRQNGKSYVGLLDHDSGSFSKLDVPFSSVTNIVSGNGSFYVEGASGSLPVSIAKVTLDEKRTMATNFSIVWSSSEDITKYTSYFSSPEFMKFPTAIPGQHAYAYFYAPHNHNFQGSSDEKPPLLVRTHGGPTDEARGVLDLSVQYWTSRGWALVDVNYGGSAGYGREYRERLLGQWGVVDVNDCCSCATFLVETGIVDGQRLCVAGESAGGFTTLACLAFRQIFKAGASLYGIADLASLREGMHKFEAHYIDNLVGNKQAYFERSPINFVERFTCPVILFQGLEDPVVSPDQATTIYKAIKDKGLPVALVEYEGEQHGFRKAENIKFTLEQEMMFFARLVGHFEVADDITPIKIDNFDKSSL